MKPKTPEAFAQPSEPLKVAMVNNKKNNQTQVVNATIGMVDLNVTNQVKIAKMVHADK